MTDSVKRGFVLFEPRDGSTRWIQPIPELAFRVQLRFLSDEEQAAIFDRHRVYPGSQKNTMAKLGNVAGDMIEARVVAWENPETIFPDVPEDWPCSGQNKQRLQKVLFHREGEDTTNLWRMIVEAEEKALEEERKN